MPIKILLYVFIVIIANVKLVIAAIYTCLIQQAILWSRKRLNAIQRVMDKINDLTKDFLEALVEIEIVLRVLFFKRYSFFEKGLAYFIEYRKENNSRVEFLFGPSNWDIEMIIYTSNGKFAFKDLLIIPEIENWVNINRYKQENSRNIKNELDWFVDFIEDFFAVC